MQCLEATSAKHCAASASASASSAILAARSASAMAFSLCLNVAAAAASLSHSYSSLLQIHQSCALVSIPVSLLSTMVESSFLPISKEKGLPLASDGTLLGAIL
ncbi:hypothetical protein HAX54_029124 [Datura stramonium]|uniref:Secreted protein n=1 Tax=Datura stramonium TaxID=4076 RepID=A0ABS8S9Y4_DATST|nr:hypothetical protein [Datura stramonium]